MSDPLNSKFYQHIRERGVVLMIGQAKLHQALKRINLVCDEPDGISSCHYDTLGEFIPKLKQYYDRGIMYVENSFEKLIEGLMTAFLNPEKQEPDYYWIFFIQANPEEPSHGAWQWFRVKSSVVEAGMKKIPASSLAEAEEQIKTVDESKRLEIADAERARRARDTLAMMDLINNKK